MASKVYRAAIRSTFPGDVEVLNVLHYADEGDTQTPEEVANNIWDEIETTYRAVVRDDATIEDLTLVEVPLDSTPLPEPGTYTLTINELGTWAEAAMSLSPGLTAVGQLKTGLAGRRHRGRIWLPPPCDKQEPNDATGWRNTSGRWFNNALALMPVLAGTGYGGTTRLVVYSGKAASENADNVWWEVTDWSLPNVQHFLRSRREPGP